MDYTVTFSVSFKVCALDELDAEDKARQLCSEEWGKAFSREAGVLTETTEGGE